MFALLELLGHRVCLHGTCSPGQYDRFSNLKMPRGHLPEDHMDGSMGALCKQS